MVVDSAEMTPEQAAIMAPLTERARRFRAASEEGTARNYAIWKPGKPASGGNRRRQCRRISGFSKRRRMRVHPIAKRPVVRNLLTHYREHPKTTLVVFMERGFEKNGFNLAKSIVDDLVAGGIPRKEIAIVDGSTSADRRKAVPTP